MRTVLDPFRFLLFELHRSRAPTDILKLFPGG
jgi:hypothetical protein